MAVPQVHQKPAAPESPESTDLFDYDLIADYLRYVVGAIGRHKLLCVGVAAGMVAATFIAIKVLPRTYHCETKLLAQRNQVISALGNPGRTNAFDFDLPTRAAAETVLQHDNLISLVKQTDAVKRWQQTRAPILALKDALMRALRGPESPEDLQAALVGLLETRLEVKVGEGTVTIGVDWPDAEGSLRLTEAAQRNFLEARHISEVSTISEAISILEGHAYRLRDQIEETAKKVATLRKDSPVRPAKKKVVRPIIHAQEPIPVRNENPHSQEIAQLQSLLEGKRRVISDLLEYHQRRISEMKAKLAEQREIYSDAHPAIIELQLNLDALQKQEPAQLQPLRHEERELEDQLARYQDAAPLQEVQPRPALAMLPVEVSRVEREARESEDPSVANALGELKFGMTKYATLLDRIDSARMEMETSRAAFKHRYSVIMPAERPRSPKKPKPGQVLAAGVIAALLLSVVAAVAADLRAARLVERWQVGRQLEVEILGEVRLP
jgi:uncharacterized protein involved in exopolysaccharide biosynthesis